jgi:hypothetical protein
MMRVLFIAGLSLLFAGCSRVQFAYNQLDWLIPYYVDTQIELTDSQEDYLQQRVDALLDWHCSTHLKAYADLLRSANTDFQNGTMSEQKLRHLFSQVELYWKEIKQQANPAIAHLLLTASDSQVEELFNNFTNKDIEWLEWFDALSDEELRLDYQKNMTKELERWFGPLQASQQRAVVDWSLRFEPLGMESYKARYRWHESLRDLMEQRDDVKTFNSGVEQLLVNTEMIYTSEYVSRVDHNTKISIELILFVGSRLDDSQRKHLARKVGSVVGDFDQLACTGENREKQVTWDLRDTVSSNSVLR